MVKSSNENEGNGNSNGYISIKQGTFWLIIVSMVISMAVGAYGASRTYTDLKCETINSKLDTISMNVQWLVEAHRAP
jgi:hypothetical protein